MSIVAYYIQAACQFVNNGHNLLSEILHFIHTMDTYYNTLLLMNHITFM